MQAIRSQRKYQRRKRDYDGIHQPSQGRSDGCLHGMVHHATGQVMDELRAAWTAWLEIPSPRKRIDDEVRGCSAQPKDGLGQTGHKARSGLSSLTYWSCGLANMDALGYLAVIAKMTGYYFPPPHCRTWSQSLVTRQEGSATA